MLTFTQCNTIMPTTEWMISSILAQHPDEDKGLSFSALLCASASLRESKIRKISA